MSEEKKVSVPSVGESFFDAFKAGLDVSPEQLMKVLITHDVETLPYICDIKNPGDVALVKTLIRALKDAKYVETAGVYETFLEAYFIASISKDRQSRKEIRDAYVSIVTQQLQQKKTTDEKLFGKRG